MEKSLVFSHKKRFFRVFLPKIFKNGVILIGIGSILNIIYIMIWKKQPVSDQIVANAILLVVVGITMYVGASISINLYPKIKVTDGGLALQMVFLRAEWILLPWSEVKAITSSFATFQLTSVWVISIEDDLPRWKNNLRLRFSNLNYPAIVVSSDLVMQTEFLNVISEYIDCDALKD